MVAYEYAGVDGAHHKQWVIDQMVRSLIGEDYYSEWVKLYELPGEDGGICTWDIGIAP